MHNIHAYVLLCNERNISVCCKLTQLHSRQILLKSVNIWLSYWEKQKGELFLKHSVYSVNGLHRGVNSLNSGPLPWQLIQRQAGNRDMCNIAWGRYATNNVEKSYSDSIKTHALIEIKLASLKSVKVFFILSESDGDSLTIEHHAIAATAECSVDVIRLVTSYFYKIILLQSL